MIILHPVYYGRMRKSLLILLFFVSLGGVHKASAQLDKHYFFYVGRSYIIDNKFRDAIETLNVLLKVDEKAYEGYFLRGIAQIQPRRPARGGTGFFLCNREQPRFYGRRTSTGDYPVRGWVITTMQLKDFQVAIDLRPDRPTPILAGG